jgi:hypothetical protein
MFRFSIQLSLEILFTSTDIFASQAKATLEIYADTCKVTPTVRL